MMAVAVKFAAPGAMTATDTQSAQATGRPFWLRWGLMLGVPAVAIAIGLWVWLSGGRYVTSENAYVKANLVEIGADVSGRVVSVLVHDNQRVAKGTILFRIDPEPFVLAVAQADAEVKAAKARIASLKAEHRQIQAERMEFAARLQFLDAQYQRQKQLMARRIGTAENYDRAYRELQAGKQRVLALAQRSETSLAMLAGSVDIRPELHPEVMRAIAIRGKAALDLRRTQVAAPTDGVLSKMSLQPGEYVTAGKPVFSLVEIDRPWVEINLKETRTTDVRPGQKAWIEADAYPGMRWEATVESVAAATGAEFALLPPQNASGNWVKVVQRVPVRLRITPNPDAPPLRAGLTVTATIDTASRSQRASTEK